MKVVIRAPASPAEPACAASGCSVSAAASAAGSLAVAIRSMSLQVSVIRRAEPATATASQAGCSRSAVGELLGDRQHLRQQHPTRRALLAEPVERREHALLELRAQPLDRAHALLLGGRPQVVEAGDPELVVEPARGLRADTRQPRDLHERRRELRLQLGRGGDLAGVEQGDDLSLERGADPRQLGHPAGAGQLLDRDRALLDHPRRLAVGEHPVADRAVELVQGGELGHRGGDLGVAHGHRA